MRILLVTDCYLPSTTSAARMIHDLALEFTRRGHLPTILCPEPTITESVRQDSDSGIQILRVQCPPTKNLGRIQRGYNELRLSGTVWRKAGKQLRKTQYDLIVFYSPSIFWGPLVQKLKACSQCPTYLVLRDIFPHWAIDAGVIRNPFVKSILRHYESRQYSVSDVIGVETPANLTYFEHRLPAVRSRVEVLHNWIDVSANGSHETKYRERLGLHDKTVIFYGGNLGVAQDIDNILRLCQALRSSQKAHLLIVGDGEQAGKLKNYLARTQNTHVTYLPPVPQDQYLSMVREFDIGLISLHPDLTTYNYPGKMLAYMLHGMPILGSINSGNPLKDLIESTGAGFVSINGDDSDFHENALRLIKDPSLRKQQGTNARKLLEEQFSVKAAADQILAHLL